MSKSTECSPRLLFSDSEWSFELLEDTFNVIENIAKEKYGFDYYPASIEVITAEQMLDNYSSHALPIYYDHWSFGKSFIQNQDAYKKGKQGLAYEVVINSNPSIAYLMETNTMTMQALVLAHASIGHSSFFKNNYLFKDWTDADSIIDYLKFARNYIRACEEKYGYREVEEILDACHSLQLYGVDKYKRSAKIDEEMRQKSRAQFEEETFNDIWRTVPAKEEEELDQDINTSEENLLYFIEKNSPILEGWQREIVRIVRKIAQYFYPQRQTMLMNEGWACFVHHLIMTDMHEQGYISDGSYLEFLHSHSSVVFQPEWDSPYFSGINIYALGFAMFKDIRRMCENPTDEDKKWFPEIVDTDWISTTKSIMENYRDESFVSQFLSPKIVRDFKLFNLNSDQSDMFYHVTRVHDDEDFKKLREKLSDQYDPNSSLPHIEVTDVDWKGDRALKLTHYTHKGRLLEYTTAKKTMMYVHDLWGFTVEIEYKDYDGNVINNV